MYTQIPRPDSVWLNRLTPSVSLERGYNLVTTMPGDEPCVKLTKYIPDTLFDKYLDAAMHEATAERVDDGEWVAEITALPGVWADSDSQATAFKVLREVVAEWLFLKIEDEDGDIPRMGGVDLNAL